jgi:hypothetical protein
MMYLVVSCAATKGGNDFSVATVAVRLADTWETETTLGSQLKAVDDAEVRRRCSV